VSNVAKIARQTDPTFGSTSPRRTAPYNLASSILAPLTVRSDLSL
jgi:hypothetical protein